MASKIGFDLYTRSTCTRVYTVLFHLKQQEHIKYLGVLLDDKMNWQYHTASVCARVAQSTVIFYRLRHFLSHAAATNLSYPYLSTHFLCYVAWGSAYKTHVNKLQVKQNHFARVVFFWKYYMVRTRHQHCPY